MEGIVRGRRAEIAFSIAPCAKLDFRQVTKGSSDFIKRARGGPICLEKLSVCLHFFIPFPRMCRKRKKKYMHSTVKNKSICVISVFCLFVCCLSAFYGSVCGEILRKTEVSCKLVPCAAFPRIEKKKKKKIFLIEILHVPPLLGDAFNLNQHG